MKISKKIMIFCLTVAIIPMSIIGYTSFEEMSTNMNSVAVEQSSTNINMVAAAAEEMTATINEISQNNELSDNLKTAVNQFKI